MKITIEQFYLSWDNLFFEFQERILGNAEKNLKMVPK